MATEENIKYISLTRGKFSAVDAKDFAWLNQWKWHCSYWGYAVRFVYFGTVNGKPVKQIVRMHRLITDAPEGMHVDHIDHDPLNNRRSNLRVCTNHQNRFNTKITKGSSIYKGVCWVTRDKKWKASITVNSKHFSLGHYFDEKEAARAYNVAALAAFGSFAHLNEVEAEIG